MDKLSKFKPMMAMCSQGQKRKGVDEGSLFMYNRIFRHICDSKPYVVQNNQFNKIDGYKQIYNICYNLSKTGPFMCIGGDHSVAAPSVLASLQRHPNLNVLWVDAHPDVHTSNSSESGNSHGMPVSAITEIEKQHFSSRTFTGVEKQHFSSRTFTGLEKQHFSSPTNMNTLPFDRLTYTGIRDIDDFEAKTIKEKGIRSLNVEDTLRHIHTIEGPIHISFDIDSLDPSYVTSTGTPVPGGLSPEDVEAIFEECLNLDKLVSCDVVEFNGNLGDPEQSIKAVKQVFKQCFNDFETEEEFRFMEA